MNTSRGIGEYSRAIDRLERETVKYEVDVDVIITHPNGMTKELKDQIFDALIVKAESLGCSVGGSFTMVGAQ